ncbi:RNA polymerase subunit sigma [Aneurinibacillus migulanus]|uniref:RNA polymerase sigma-70 factor, ECF subfamily n=1 Tax=Aneurinibacillus migulanus TaxID=47500 RepID=A0A0D1YFZ7_ANEMI|nr:sigma-70 family RNA polymerase sigma factor [Aneurinibacillus migulanus]KIV53272.1 hypothetical protein TS64_20035 [Aneurinibacillus migulanus]KIV57837.1 hypothetical protein TS65_08050 [Aneurinibacillus migulanus]KON97407.1 hypothetical protein AF333_19980 [Aneurinibacillus migulanus]KPD07330.1 RNA polymerase subunit sigma [Aneurinibacillus migulanus]MCP1356405.1 sigma-70 family RNA polymerase sigma factor [Aneurinibacillus migulanus]
MTEAELHEWLSKMAVGDKEAFEVIYRETKEHVYRTVSFLLRNKQDVCDVVSEVYIELFKSLPNYNARQPFRAWLNGLTIRQTQNWNRKVWRRFRLYDRSKLLEAEKVSTRIEKEVIEHENTEELLSVLQNLSYKLKTVLVLRYYHDHSFEEIATILDISVNTAKSRHRVALQKLKTEAIFSLEDKGALLDANG